MRTKPLVLFLVLSACGPQIVVEGPADVPFSPEPREPAPDAGPLLDEQLLQIGQRVPGFGGLFFDEDGRLAVYLRTADQSALPLPADGEPPALRAVLTEVLGAERLAAGLRLLPGRFSIAELHSYRKQVEAQILSAPGVVLVDLDEARNRVRIGVSTLAAQTAATDALCRLGVPKEATLVEELAELMPLASLRDYHRPPPGGAQIAFGGALCTLGFNARRGTALGFVTNAHCTTRRGVRDGTIYYQPVLSEDLRIGVEALDPAARTGDACPSGRRCRYSDSAFVRYEAGQEAAPGAIAQLRGLSDPTEPVRGTLPIVALGAAPLVGERVTKTGRTTGRTAGAVIATCATINVQGSQQTQLCQTVVRAAVGPGDSGSPVYKERGGDAHLMGLLWGGSGDHFVFSPIRQVLREGELGPMRLCTTGAGC